MLPGDRLLLTTDYGLPAVLLQIKHDGDKWTTEEIWTTNHMRTKFTTPVVRDHYAYGLDDDALACIDLNDEGKQVWQAGRSDRSPRPGAAGRGPADRAGRKRQVALVKADPSGYHKLGALPAFKSKTWNNPALAGNRLFLRNDQEAACYELATVENSGSKASGERRVPPDSSLRCSCVE